MAGSSTVAYGTYTRAKISARHNACDSHLMSVLAAIDTFRQDNRRMPYSLDELVKRRYASVEMLRCPADPHLAEHSSEPDYTSYGNTYVLRDVLDNDQLPTIVCPYHDDDGGSGEQAYKTLFTKRARVSSATLAAGDWSGAVTVTRSNRVLVLPQGGDPPLALQGGDHFSLGAGKAKITFADTSTADMEPNTKLTVLQSFLQNQQRGSLYTIVHQALGTVHYYVNPGSSFDVSTPTATAGALGTRFTVTVRPCAKTLSYPFESETLLNVTEHKVAFTALGKTTLVLEGEPQISDNSAEFRSKLRRPRPAPSQGLTISYSSSTGGTTAGGTTSGGTTAGGTTSGGTTSGGTTAGGTTSGGTTAGGTGGTTSGGSTGSSTTSGGMTTGSPTTGASTSGSTTSGGTSSGSSTSGGSNGGSTTSGSSNSGDSATGGSNSGGSTSGHGHGNDDGNNGGGNDGGGKDDSNPGKGKGKDKGWIITIIITLGEIINSVVR